MFCNLGKQLYCQTCQTGQPRKKKNVTACMNLCNVVLGFKAFPSGVWFANGLTYLATLLKIYTPSATFCLMSALGTLQVSFVSTKLAQN